MTWLDKIHVGDCRALMRQMIDAGVRVNCIVTSPPYWGLRDYGVAGQFGLERTWLRHVARMRGVFRLARELLADDGVAWVNYGDSYHNADKGGYQPNRVKAEDSMQASNLASDFTGSPNRQPQRGLKSKDLVGMPWRVAFALQSDGWYLRSDVIWAKPNPMPESVTDRPTKSHEYLFLLTRSARYHYDAQSIAEIAVSSKPAGNGFTGRQGGSAAHIPTSGGGGTVEPWNDLGGQRNARTVWTITTTPFPGAHFATFPRELVRRCILAGSRPGDTVFDPFMGSGTVAEVALSLGRHFIGCELNPEYAAMFKQHRSQQVGMSI